ncbi:hypothetical protein [Actinomycetospora cinnamomea]|uniref:Uncharacterized protein n=1 Tax=Actinomycetospora cinnamomea TaxID=663609 RepID=A0A2U1FBA9_9PSEU|nr:hypothetical protein [Actinomycetospora cinnamomea]PVZ09481.1 hypothetical protein C8D89_106142 [Actinomycetospora cinnamomea]
MDPDHDPPRRVPAPRAGGHDAGGDPGGEARDPFVPVPRRAPAVERLPDGVTTSTEPPAPASAALVPAPRPAADLAAGEAGVPRALRSWVRAVARAVRIAVDGVRSLLDALVPAPASR